MGTRHNPLLECRRLIEAWRTSGLSVRAIAVKRGTVPGDRAHERRGAVMAPSLPQDATPLALPGHSPERASFTPPPRLDTQESISGHNPGPRRWVRGPPSRPRVSVSS
jgi:hypothetical protein